MVVGFQGICSRLTLKIKEDTENLISARVKWISI